MAQDAAMGLARLLAPYGTHGGRFAFLFARPQEWGLNATREPVISSLNAMGEETAPHAARKGREQLRIECAKSNERGHLDWSER